MLSLSFCNAWKPNQIVAASSESQESTALDRKRTRDPQFFSVLTRPAQCSLHPRSPLPWPRLPVPVAARHRGHTPHPDDPIGAADTMRRCLPGCPPADSSPSDGHTAGPRRSARVQAARPRGRAGARGTGTAPRCLGRARTRKPRSRRPRRAAHRLLMRRAACLV